MYTCYKHHCDINMNASTLTRIEEYTWAGRERGHSGWGVLPVPISIYLLVNLAVHLNHEAKFHSIQFNYSNFI